jgi:hypothetical protein
LNSKITVDEEGNIDTHDKINPTKENSNVKNLNKYAPEKKIKGIKVQGSLMLLSAGHLSGNSLKCNFPKRVQ